MFNGRGKTIKGAFAAWLSVAHKKAQGVTNMNGIRYDAVFKDYCMAASIVSRSSHAFDRANLFEGAALHPDSLRRSYRELVGPETDFFDMDPAALVERANAIVGTLHV
jgi:hypothetical protein